MPFLKKTLTSNPRPVYKPRCVYEIYTRKIEARQLTASFQIVWRIATRKQIPLLQLQNYYSFYWKMKSSKEVYFINIRLLFSRIFCKNRFYSFIRNLLKGVIMEITTKGITTAKNHLINLMTPIYFTNHLKRQLIDF